MDNQDFEQALRLSYYKEIATLDEAHNITIVQHAETARTYVKKTLSLYSKDVYTELMAHPIIGVPKIFEIFEVDGKLVVIEEYISGITLENMLEYKQTLPAETVKNYIIKLCDILTGLHSLVPPIIHRDIKPSNVILTDDERLVLIDMNGAKLANSSQTRDTVLIGTQGYAAPEQYGFGASNTQTDIYAIGKLMTCLLTGNPDNINACPWSLKNIISKCTRIEPDQRYVSALQLKNALSKNGIGKFERLAPIIISCSIGFTLIFTFILFLSKKSKDNPNSVSSENFTIQEFSDITPSVVADNTPSVAVDNTPSVAVDNTPSNIPKATDSVDKVSSELDFSNPIGVYEGNDREKLVIAENGFAYYYCYSEEFTEVECPWTLTDDMITISFSVMHCDITATTKAGFNELVFKSESLNWNSEVFTKISNDAVSAILDPPPSPVDYISLTHSGEKQFKLDGLLFTIPKHFRIGTPEAFKNPQLGKSNGIITSIDDWVDGNLNFIDSDIGESYIDEAFVSFIAISPLTAQSVEIALSNPKAAAKETASHFLNSAQVNYTETIDIAGRECPLICINGLLNAGFGGLSGYVMTGYIVLLPVKDNTGIMVIQMLQRAGMKLDNSEYFLNILNTAEKCNG